MADKNGKGSDVTVVDVAEDRDESKAANARPGEGHSGTMVVMIIGLLVMLLTPLASYFVVKLSQPATSEKAAAAPEEASPATAEMVMEMLMVNIAETKGTRVLRITPHLVLSEEGAAAKLTPMKAMLIDKIAGVASARTIDELDGAKGRELLKDDIKKGLNALIEHKMAGSVVDVYFSEYLIQ